MTCHGIILIIHLTETLFTWNRLRSSHGNYPKIKIISIDWYTQKSERLEILHNHKQLLVQGYVKERTQLKLWTVYDIPH